MPCGKFPAVLKALKFLFCWEILLHDILGIGLPSDCFAAFGKRVSVVGWE